MASDESTSAGRNSMLRKMGGVVAGMLVVICVVTVIQFASGRLYPLPEGVSPFDPADAEAFAAYVDSLPVPAWLMAFGSELLGALLGGLTAGRIARDQRLWVSGLVVGLAMAASITNWGTFPHPIWFIAGQVVGYPLVLLAIARVLRRHPPPAASE
jgi:hypothetical protein